MPRYALSSFHQALLAAVSVIGFLTLFFFFRGESFYRSSLSPSENSPFLLLDSDLWENPSEAETADRVKDSANFAFQLDLNRATWFELALLPGMGETLSKKVVDYREKNGPFQDVSDVMKVQGIGQKKYKKMSPYLTLSQKGL